MTKNPELAPLDLHETQDLLIKLVCFANNSASADASVQTALETVYSAVVAELGNLSDAFIASIKNGKKEVIACKIQNLLQSASASL